MGKTELHAVFRLWTARGFVETHNSNFLLYLAVPSILFAFFIASEH